MNKQNRLLLKAFKAVVKLAEASQKKQEYVQSSSRSCCHEIVVPRDLRAGGYTPKTDTTGTPPDRKTEVRDKLIENGFTPPSGKNLDELWDTLVENGLQERMGEVVPYTDFKAMRDARQEARKTIIGKVARIAELERDNTRLDDENTILRRLLAKENDATGIPSSGKNLDGLWDTLVENGLKDRQIPDSVLARYTNEIQGKYFDARKEVAELKNLIEEKTTDLNSTKNLAHNRGVEIERLKELTKWQNAEIARLNEALLVRQGENQPFRKTPEGATQEEEVAGTVFEGEWATTQPPVVFHIDDIREVYSTKELRGGKAIRHAAKLRCGKKVLLTKEQVAEWEGKCNPKNTAQIWCETVKQFAGDDAAHVQSLLEGIGSTRLVHVKCAELGTETLVALSPEGETLARIVKDNSKKYSKI